MQTVRVDGVDLRQRDQGWYLTWGTRLPAPASQQVVHVSTPYMDGVIPTRQGWRLGRVNLELIVRGTDENMRARVSRLVMLLANARTVTTVEGRQELTAKVVESQVGEPDWSALGSVKLTAQLTVAPFWSDGEKVTQARPLGTGKTVVRFPAFAGCTGRLMDAVVKVRGVQGSFTVTDRVSGRSWKQVKSDASGREFVFDTAHPKFVEDEVEFGKAGPLRVYPAWSDAVFPPGADALSIDGSEVVLEVEAANVTRDAQITLEGTKWFI